MVALREWDRLAAMADAVVESCGRVEVRQNEDAERSEPAHLLALAVKAALTARTSEGEDAASVAAHCFNALLRPYHRRARMGAVSLNEFLPPLVAEALLAAGWLAQTAAKLLDGDGPGADEAARNCLDACVRLHVFTGVPGSRVEAVYKDGLARRRKGPGVE
jgi:hypothetical protein